MRLNLMIIKKNFKKLSMIYKCNSINKKKKYNKKMKKIDI